MRTIETSVMKLNFTAKSLVCLIFAFGVAACGGKSKKESTLPAQTAQKTQNSVVDPANFDPTGDDTFGATALNNQDEDDYQGPKPPGVDLTPEKRTQVVTSSLQTGQAALTRADSDQAIAEARKALEADETSVEAMVVLARANYMKGYLDLSEDILNKAIERGGERNKQVHFLLGVIYEKTDRKEDAPAKYQAALALDPNYQSALMNLGVSHLENRRYSDAISVYEKLTNELGVDTEVAWTNLGSAYRGKSVEYNLSNPSTRNEYILKAEKSYQKALSKKQSYKNAHFNLGLLYLDADPFPKGDDSIDTLERLKTARRYFNDYQKLSGSDQKLAEGVIAVTQKLINKEEKLRKKAAERAAKDAARKAREEAGGDDDDDFDSDEGFE